jgi:lipase
MTRFRTLSWGSEQLPAVVCLHGVCGHARQFERLARMVEERHVIAYDLRGHGRSPWSGGQSLDQHVEDLCEVVAASDVEQTVLVGHSLGARVALEYAADRGDRVTGLVLLDPPLFSAGRLLRESARTERLNGAYPSVDAAIDAYLSDGRLVHTPRALLEEEMAEHLVADEDGTFRLRYSREAAAQALEALADGPAPRLKEVVCPTLLVRAERSPLLTEADAEQAAAELRRCTSRVVPGGHAVLWDSLAETGALVRAFLLAGIRA